MATSSNIFVKQSHLTMPSSGWLHVNGVSMSTDIHQYQQPADYRMKHVSSPSAAMLSPPTSVPFTTTMLDGQHNNRQYQKIENADSPKKLFLDRQIKKAKSLPGLIKGSALSRHTSLHSASYINPEVSNPTTNNTLDDSFHVVVADNDVNSVPVSQEFERTNETRRHRVYFADFNKVQFFDNNNEDSQQSTSLNTHRRRRKHSSKKSTPVIANNHVSPPSIQHCQTLYTPYRPLSRQQQVGNELNIRKHQITASPRVYSSRITHLPDILNQSLPVENSIHEKYSLQREKSFIRLPEPAVEIPINSSAEISRESTRAGGMRSSAVHDYNDQNYKFESNDGGTAALFNSGSISSSLTGRQRPLLRTISLRQQFTSPIKLKTTGILNSQQSMTNARRSASLKHSIPRMHSVDDENEELHNNESYLTLENRPITGINSSKQLKRNYVLHFNSKSPSNGNTTLDSNESNRHFLRSSYRDTSPERFQNLLKVVRPPYVTGPPHDSTIPTTTNTINGSLRSSRTNSGRGPHEFHVSSNTIIV